MDMRNCASTRRGAAEARTARWTHLIIVVVLAAIGLAGVAAQAATWYADAARSDDAGDGLSWDAAKRTIGAAIAASAAGDTILVKYGTYAVGEAAVLNSDRCLGSDDGTHATWDTAAPDSSQCVVAADATCRVLTITGGAVTAATCVRGFTFTGGDATGEGDPNYGYGGGVDVNGGADPIVERCRMTGNLAGHTFNGFGGGLSVRGAGTSAVVRHCRIDNNTGSSAWYAYGGGLYIGSSGYALVHDCVVTGNRGSTARVGGGGGAAFYGGSGQLLDCVVSSNIATTLSAGVGGSGGGVYVYAGTATVQRCAITDNIATDAAGQGSGGGVFLNGGTTQILDCAVARNIASTRGAGNGGGINSSSGQTILRNLIEDNYGSTSTTGSDGSGGGVVLRDSNTQFKNNLIRNNVASAHGDGRGGGIYFESTNTMERNVILGNVASGGTPGYGGGAYTGGGYRSSFRNNTVIGNANVVAFGATGAGSGFYEDAAGGPYIQNNIFCGHTVSGSDGVGFYSAGAMTIDYNCFFDNAGGACNVLVTSNNQLDADPRFTDAGAGDFTLAYDSPCIEAGNPATVVPENGGWVVDDGAFEYTGTRHWRAIAGAGEYLFGGRVKARVNLTDPGTVTAIDMVVHPGEQHPGAPGSVARHYAIEATGGSPVFNLTLSYLDAELAGADENILALWRWLVPAWEGPKTAIARDTAANWLTVGAQTAFSEWVIAEDLSLVGVGDDTPARPAFALAPNRPNPFNPSTRLEYSLPAAARVRLTVYDVAGRLVRTLVDAELPAGAHAAAWDGTDDRGRTAPSGTYVARLEADGRVATGRMGLVR
jgi:hypothetical protein